MWIAIVFLAILGVVAGSASSRSDGDLPKSQANSFELFPADAIRNRDQFQEPLFAEPFAHFLPKVCIEQGCILGRTRPGNIPHEAFFSIPYAAPPVGKLRFRDPKKPAPFASLWDGTYERSQCVQTSLYDPNYIFGSEDCLYLNVFKPMSTVTLYTKPLPVLVFIHGGSFKYGSALVKDYDPVFLMDTRKALVVTVQFRLGVFGLLSSGDPNCPGNFALKDQQMALKWVRDNIGAFGGDPERVTLMGEDSGAAAVNLHMMSPRSAGLFKKAIMIGGHAFAYWSFLEDPKEQFQQYAKLAGVKKSHRESSEWVMDYLRNRTAEEVQMAANRMPSLHPVHKEFRPTIEGTWKGAFLTRSAKEIWKSGDFQHMPFWIIMPGYPEGQFADVVYNKTLRNAFLENFDENLAAAGDLSKKAVKKIKKFYFNNDPNRHNFHRLLDFFREWGYLNAAVRMVRYYSKYADMELNPVDLMLFNVTSTVSLSTRIHDFVHLDKGASQTDPLLYVFKYPSLISHLKRGPVERSVQNLMIGLVTRYMTKRLPHWPNSYEKCTAQTMENGFCKYLLLMRDAKGNIQYTATNYTDPETRGILQKVADYMGF